MKAWTDDRVEMAKKLWLQGQSAGEIAKRIRGTTRCAVLSKMNRLGLLRGAASGPTKSGPARIRVASNGHRTYRLPPSLPLEPAPATGPLPMDARPWIERSNHECAYPLDGEGMFTVSCCKPAGRGPYCPEHRAVVYDKKPVSKLKPGMADEERRRRDALDLLPGMAA